VELVLGMDTAAHSSEDEDIFVQSDSDTDSGTDKDPPHIAFWLQDKEDQPHPQGNYRHLTQAITDTGSCSVRECGFLYITPESKKQEWNSSALNAM
jgi:hypothetical protein